MRFLVVSIAATSIAALSLMGCQLLLSDEDGGTSAQGAAGGARTTSASTGSQTTKTSSSGGPSTSSTDAASSTASSAGSTSSTNVSTGAVMLTCMPGQECTGKSPDYPQCGPNPSPNGCAVSECTDYCLAMEKLCAGQPQFPQDDGATCCQLCALFKDNAVVSSPCCRSNALNEIAAQGTPATPAQCTIAGAFGTKQNDACGHQAEAACQVLFKVCAEEVPPCTLGQCVTHIDQAQGATYVYPSGADPRGQIMTLMLGTLSEPSMKATNCATAFTLACPSP